jgi:hypothetical protein
MTRVDALETCLRQVADDMGIAARYLRVGTTLPEDVRMAEMLEQSAAAAREVATDEGGGQ